MRRFFQLFETSLNTAAIYESAPLSAATLRRVTTRFMRGSPSTENIVARGQHQLDQLRQQTQQLSLLVQPRIPLPYASIHNLLIFMLDIFSKLIGIIYKSLKTAVGTNLLSAFDSMVLMATLDHPYTADCIELTTQSHRIIESLHAIAQRHQLADLEIDPILTTVAEDIRILCFSMASLDGLANSAIDLILLLALFRNEFFALFAGFAAESNYPLLAALFIAFNMLVTITAYAKLAELAYDIRLSVNALAEVRCGLTTYHRLKELLQHGCYWLSNTAEYASESRLARTQVYAHFSAEFEALSETAAPLIRRYFALVSKYAVKGMIQLLGITILTGMLPIQLGILPNMTNRYNSWIALSVFDTASLKLLEDAITKLLLGLIIREFLSPAAENFTQALVLRVTNNDSMENRVRLLLQNSAQNLLFNPSELTDESVLTETKTAVESTQLQHDAVRVTSTAANAAWNWLYPDENSDTTEEFQAGFCPALTRATTRATVYAIESFTNWISSQTDARAITDAGPETHQIRPA